MVTIMYPGEPQLLTQVSRIIAKIGIPSDKYQKDWKSRLRRERYKFLTNFSLKFIMLQ